LLLVTAYFGQINDDDDDDDDEASANYNEKFIQKPSGKSHIRPCSYFREIR